MSGYFTGWITVPIPKALGLVPDRSWRWQSALSVGSAQVPLTVLTIFHASIAAGDDLSLRKQDGRCRSACLPALRVFKGGRTC